MRVEIAEALHKQEDSGAGVGAFESVAAPVATPAAGPIPDSSCELVPLLGSPMLPMHIHLQQSENERKLRKFQKIQTILIICLVSIYIFVNVAALFATPLLVNKFEPVERSDVRFDDVQGCDSIKNELVKLVDFLKNPQKFERFGATIPRGYLLTGPPGVGKTFLAKALAGEAGVPLYAVSAAEFEEIYLGLGAARVRALFSEARKRGRAIIFIDEIDAVGGKRDSMSGQGTSLLRQTLNQLLVEMDGFNTNEGVIVLAATNTPAMLDDALLRPGRFDHTFALRLPGLAGRLALLQRLFSKIPLETVDASVDLEELAKKTIGMSGAQLTQIVNQCKLIAASDPSSNRITAKHVEEAYLHTTMGPANSPLTDPEFKRSVAHHEAGHALASLLTPNSFLPSLATILPRGDSNGAVHFILEDDNQTNSKAAIEARIRVALAGYLAEKKLYGDKGISFGASADLNEANKLARQLVHGGFGPRTGFFRKMDPREAVSDRVIENVDADINQFLSEATKDVEALLNKYEAAWRALAQALIEDETISREQMIEILRNNGAGSAFDNTPRSLQPKRSKILGLF